MTIVVDSKSHRPWTDDGYVGDFAVRQMSARFGVPHEGHAHWIDHLTVIVKGPVRIDWKDPDTGESGSIEIRHTPWVLNMPAERWHQFVALSETGAEWFCIFSGAQGDAAGIPRNDFNFERLTHG